MEHRIAKFRFYKTLLGATCWFILICSVGARVHADDTGLADDHTGLTVLFAEETILHASLSGMTLDYELPQGKKLGDMQGATLNKEGTALEKDFEFVLPPGTEPKGSIELKDPLKAQAKTGHRYWIPKDTPVEYVLPVDSTYKVKIPKGTKLTKEPSTQPPQYALAQKITVEISPPKNSQATMKVGAQRMVERVPGTSGTGTTLTIEPEKAPVGGYITLTVGKNSFEFSKAQFYVSLKAQGMEPNVHPFVPSKDVELKEVQKGKAKLRARVPEIGAGPVDLLVVARGTGGEVAEVVSREFKVSSSGWALGCGISAFVLPWIFAAIVATRRAPKSSRNLRDRLRLDPIWFVSGKYGSASLSLAQILLWTILVFSASFYVLVASGKLLALTNDVLMLLGIAGTSSVIAKIAASVKDERGREIAADEKEQLGLKVIEDPKWLDLVKTEGRPDLYKFQMALFTALAAFFVIDKIYGTFEFPELPAGLLALMGISNGIYLAAKATSATVFEKLAEKDRELQGAREELEKRKAELTEATSRFKDREKERNEAKQRVDETEAKLKTAPDDKKAELNQQLDQYKAALSKAEDELGKVSAKKKYLDDAVRTANSRVETLQKEFDKLKEEAAKTKT